VRLLWNEVRRRSLRGASRARPWTALVDGNNQQIMQICAQARRRKVTVTIVIDFIHVLEYLWKAAWCCVSTCRVMRTTSSRKQPEPRSLQESRIQRRIGAQPCLTGLASSRTLCRPLARRQGGVGSAGVLLTGPVRAAERRPRLPDRLGAGGGTVVAR
jgi:hypothetical protein